MNVKDEEYRKSWREIGGLISCCLLSGFFRHVKDPEKTLNKKQTKKYRQRREKIYESSLSLDILKEEDARMGS